MSRDEIISLIEDRYYSCPNVENGKCYTWWKHEDCLVLSEILFKITKNKKYNQHGSEGIGIIDKPTIDEVE